MPANGTVHQYLRGTCGTSQNVEPMRAVSYNVNMTARMDSESAGRGCVDARQSARFPMRSSLRVCCLATERALAAQGLDISATGIAFVIPEAMAPGTLVRVALPNSGLTALARVRHCQRHGLAWRAGVELLGSLM